MAELTLDKEQLQRLEMPAADNKLSEAYELVFPNWLRKRAAG